jgi:parallel beta-helix repeat protein
VEDLGSRSKGLACAIVAIMSIAMVGCQGLSAKQDSAPPPATSLTNPLGISGSIGPAPSGSGATVTLDGPIRSTTTADSSGNYSFANLANGSYTVTASKSGVTFNPTSVQVTVNGAEVTGVNFTVSGGSQNTFGISGTVSPAGNGSGATVTLGGAAAATTTTNGFGVYNFIGLANGSYTVTVSKSGFTFSPSSLPVTVNGASVTGENFTASAVPPTTYSISGTISTAANGSGATLTLSGAAGATTTANSSGNYTFTGLANGSYTVSASKSGFTFSPSSLPVTVNGANVTGENFAASAITYSISGTISTAANGSGATITLGGAASATTTANSSGNYTFTGLANGSYTVSASKSGFTFSPSSLPVTVNGANVTGENFTASAVPPTTYSISGTISTAAKGSGATLTLSGAASAATTANSSGSYTFSGLANGSYTISASKSGFTFSPSSLPVTVNGASVTGENFTASAVPPTTYSISGTISTAANGSGATITLSGAASATTTANSSGNYTFTGLANGSYTVTPRKNGFNFSPSSLQATVSGTNVTGMNFTAFAGSVVTIGPGTVIQSVVNANPAGTTFVFEPGTYRLTSPIIPKNGDSFIGEVVCAPPASSCPAILSGAKVIGSLAVFDGANYEVTGQAQRGFQQYTNECEPGWSGCFYPEDLFFDGVPLQHLYSASLPAISTGQWWFDYTNHTIYFHDNPSGHVVETSVVPTVAKVLRGPGANNITFQYLTIEEFAAPIEQGAIDPTDSGGGIQGSSLDWVVKNCELLLNHGIGVHINYGTQILNSYVHNNGQMGIGGGTNSDTVQSGIVVSGNTITYNNYAHIVPDFGAGGIKFGDTLGAVVRGNTVSYNGGAGIHFDASSSRPLIDGNTVTDNSSGSGAAYEISIDSAIVRNNILLRNSLPGTVPVSASDLGSNASVGVNAYCNVVEIPAAAGANGILVAASQRGYNTVAPYEYLVSTGNSVHHNTVIWDAGANGGFGYEQHDAANQPAFWSDNTPPDYNTYHLPSLSAAHFLYDNNNSEQNQGKTFAEYQAAGADIHGTADTNYTSGYPTVSITSPTDQSSVANPVTIAATASDASGISRVEFYVDWALQTTVTSAPYSFDWTDATTGSHTVAAMAYSNAGIRSCYAVTLNEQ